MLAAAGVTHGRSPRPPARRRSCPPATRSCRRPPARSRRARCATRPPPRSARSCAEAGGAADLRGIVPDDREALATRWPRRRPTCDVVVVSAGSSVGARDETAAAVAALGEPGIWCHGLAIKPGKPTLLAETAGGVPVVGLPGNPRSALVVFRLVGVPLVRLVGGWTDPPPEPTSTRAPRPRPPVGRRPTGRGAGAASPTGVATPLFGASALLSMLTAADGWIGRPRSGHRPARGHRGRGDPLPVSTRHFISDMPAAEALAGLAAPRAPPPAAPSAIEAVIGRPRRRRRAGHRRAGVGDPLLAAVRRGRDGRHRRARGRHHRRERDGAGPAGRPRATTWSTPATRCRTAATP